MSFSLGDIALWKALFIPALLISLVGFVESVSMGQMLAAKRRQRISPNQELVGRVPDIKHFRNIQRHDVQVPKSAALLRIDGSLYFANARYLEDTIYNLVASRPEIEHEVLICTAVILIDASALESLDAINALLKDSQVKLHLSEVKGSVMDRLKQSDFLDALTGRVFFEHLRGLARIFIV